MCTAEEKKRISVREADSRYLCPSNEHIAILPSLVSRGALPSSSIRGIRSAANCISKLPRREFYGKSCHAIKTATESLRTVLHSAAGGREVDHVSFNEIEVIMQTVVVLAKTSILAETFPKVGWVKA